MSQAVGPLVALTVGGDEGFKAAPVSNGGFFDYLQLAGGCDARLGGDGPLVVGKHTLLHTAVQKCSQ